MLKEALLHQLIWGEKMFIHIGGDIVVRTKDVIAIIDIDHSESPSKGQSFFDEVENTHEVVKITTKEEAKAFVVTTNKRIYYSPISSVTLKKRAKFFYSQETIID